MLDNPIKKQVVWIAGGNGFVGHELAYKLMSQGYNVILLSRIQSRHSDFKIAATDYSIEDLSLKFNDDDIVINLIGILNEKGFNGRGFTQAHVATTIKICHAGLKNHIKHYLHMSALHASTRGPSYYLESKATAENIVTKSNLNYTIFRPSVIFGTADSFTNRFAKLITLSPFVFPLACPKSRFQPIHIDDVVDCFVQSLELKQSINKIYDLCGPEVFSLYEIVNLITKKLGKRRKIIPLSLTASKLQARSLQLLPGKPFTMDNFKSLQVDSICTQKEPLPFSLKKTRLSDAIESYLGSL